MAVGRAVAFLLLVVCGCEATSPDNSNDDFEGVITYSVSVESKTEGLSDEYFQKFYGRELKLSIKRGNRLFEYSGAGVLILQRQGDPLEYTKRSGSEVLYSADLSVEPEPIHSVAQSDRTAVVLGRELKCVETRVGETHSSYYYTNEFPADPTAFSDRKFAATDQVLSLARSVALKTVFDGMSFRMTATATSIEPRPLDASIFRVPDMPVEPWPE